MIAVRSDSVFSGSQLQASVENGSAVVSASGARRGVRRIMAPMIQNGGNTENGGRIY